MVSDGRTEWAYQVRPYGQGALSDGATGTAGHNQAVCDAGTTVSPQELNALAFNGLMQMYNREANLFCHTLRRTASGVVQEGVSPQYTLMTLLGVHQLAAAGVPSPLPIAVTFERILKQDGWVKSIGDIGLLLWLSALAVPEHLEKIVTQFSVRQALSRAGNRSTTDLALFLTGLAHHTLAEVGRLSDLTDGAVQAFQMLRENQGEQGIFRHCARNRSVGGMLRGHIGSFADQSYSIYALAKAAQAFSLEKAATGALDCALTICEVQGPLGQWWWHYDASTGRVVDRYPVFSVHQTGTAPMALLELGQTMHSDFTPWIEKGLQWVTGGNELDQDMRDFSANVIWGHIRRDRIKRLVHTASAFIRGREDTSSSEKLSVRYECQPYNHGLLLYAFGVNGLA